VRAGGVAGTWALAAVAGAAPLAGQASRPPAGDVQAEMRHVDYRIDSTIVLQITYLRGALHPTGNQPPYFDDKRSFVLAIDSAVIGISPTALGQLLDRYVFSYPGSPLRHLSLTVKDGQVEQRGRLRGMAFSVVGELTVTPSGELRLHPTSIKAGGIPVRGLMKLFGLNLQKLVKLRGTAGVRIDQNDFLLSPAELLPPPKVRGRVTKVEVRDTAIVSVFRSEKSRIEPLQLPDSAARNYMFYRGGVLRFRKLTMTDADLMIVDADPHDPLEFFLDQYNRQLVAGYEQNTADHGLIVHMPDYRRVVEVRPQGGQRPPQP
jgi:hypothetical protein